MKHLIITPDIMMPTLTRILVIAALLFSVAKASAQDTKTLEVWKDPGCGCCGAWVEHLRLAGFSVRVHNTEQISGIKSMYGVPQNLMSCHTARIGNYIIEGHVPASDIIALLDQKPDIRGLAVPGMPLGSPGMEMPSGEKDAYDVLSFTNEGKTEMFASHN